MVCLINIGNAKKKVTEGTKQTRCLCLVVTIRKFPPADAKKRYQIWHASFQSNSSYNIEALNIFQDFKLK